MRIVIDSNVWISALVFGGNPRLIFKKVVTDGLTIVIPEEILTEVRRTLYQKFSDFIQDFEDLLGVLEPNINRIKLGSINISVSRDKDDDMLLETAIIGESSYIITGDNDLLVLVSYKNVSIVSPQQFLKTL